MNTKYIDLISQTFDFPQEEFKLEDRNLQFHDIDLMELVETYGSPLKFTYLPQISNNIHRAKGWFEKAIKKNWKLVAALAASSIGLLAVLFMIKSDFTFSYEWLAAGGWMTIAGCLMLNLLSIKPYGSNARRSRNMELLNLLKIKRERLTRVINKLSEKEINDFNNEFENYIAV